MRIARNVSLVLLLGFVAVALIGCAEEGTGESAGKEMDEAAESTTQTAEEVKEDAGKAMEDVGKTLEGN